jgi:ribonucleoside-diphosphate reductase beta chain
MTASLPTSALRAPLSAALDSVRHGITAEKGFFKPFAYPWAFEAYSAQNKAHWLPEEVPLHDDVKDWNHRLTASEKNLLTQLFRFFTTGDIDVGQAYMDKYMQAFRNEEVRMMLSSFAAMEAVHAHAYSLLLDTIGMPETEYQAFKQYEAMAAKHDYVSNFDIENEADVAKALAVFSAFTEGLQLFSTFAILMNFGRGDLPGGARMKGMNQIVTWSIRDESMHVESMLKLFRTYIGERPHLWNDTLKGELYTICETMVKLEDDFIDLAFEAGEIRGLTPAEVKQYIRYIADRRLNGLGLKAIFKIDKNPLEWLDYMLSGVEHANFFEARATEYSKGALTGSWSDVWAAMATEDIPEPAASMVEEVLGPPLRPRISEVLREDPIMASVARS